MNPSKQFFSAMVGSALALAATAQAQYVTGTQYLSNLPTPTALYAGWATATVSTESTGLRIQSSGYGSGYWVINAPDVQTIDSSSAEVRLTLTLNDTPSDYNWVGVTAILHDDLPDPTSFAYNMYSGYGNPGNPSGAVWSGNTATLTFPLAAGQLTKVQGGNDHVYALNFEFDPASLLNAKTSYDITFNSLELIVVPEPSSLALFGLAGAALLVFRRRKLR